MANAELNKLIQELSEAEIHTCEENVKLNFELYDHESRMNMIAFD